MTDHSERREQIKAYVRKEFELNLDDNVEEYLQAELRNEARQEEAARRARELRDMSDGDLVKAIKRGNEQQRPWRGDYEISDYGFSELNAELLRRFDAKQ